MKTWKLTPAETELYESAGERGDKFRREIRDRAVAALGDEVRTIEVCSADGIVFEQFRATDHADGPTYDGGPL